MKIISSNYSVIPNIKQGLLKKNELLGMMGLLSSEINHWGSSGKAFDVLSSLCDTAGCGAAAHADGQGSWTWETNSERCWGQGTRPTSSPPQGS